MDDLPKFVGEDPFGWIIKAEQFFLEQKFHSSDKVRWAFMRMEGVAMLWFQPWCQENFDANWTSFSIALMRRFGAQMKKTVQENPGTLSEPQTGKKKESKLEVIEATFVGGEKTHHNVSALDLKRLLVQWLKR